MNSLLLSYHSYHTQYYHITLLGYASASKNDNRSSSHGMCTPLDWATISSSTYHASQAHSSLSRPPRPPLYSSISSSASPSASTHLSSSLPPRSIILSSTTSIHSTPYLHHYGCQRKRLYGFHKRQEFEGDDFY